MKCYKLGKYYFECGSVGKYAYKVSKVWGLGIHIFTYSGNRVYRLVYLRTKRRSYYIQFERIGGELIC